MLTEIIWKAGPLAGLIKNSFSTSPGRSKGRIVTRHRSTPLHTRKLRIINNTPFFIKEDLAQVLRIERDPNRSAFIALVKFLKSGFLSYLPATTSLKPGSLVYLSSSFKKNTLGVCEQIAPLYSLPKGSIINNIASQPNRNFAFCRAAGTKAKLLSFSPDKRLAAVLLPSGKEVYLSSSVYAVSGTTSNASHFLNKKVKASQNRYLGIRPTVRGVAMNPIDHPMGGGEGKSAGGRPSVSPWGKLTKGGYRTLSNLKKHKHLRLSKLFNKS